MDSLHYIFGFMYRYLFDIQKFHMDSFNYRFGCCIIYFYFWILAEYESINIARPSIGWRVFQSNEFDISRHFITINIHLDSQTFISTDSYIAQHSILGILGYLEPPENNVICFLLEIRFVVHTRPFPWNHFPVILYQFRTFSPQRCTFVSLSPNSAVKTISPL